jgi:hypothetical protein
MRLVCLFVMAAIGLFAGWDQVREVGANTKIEVSIRRAEGVKGTFVSASETALIVRDATGERSIARDQIRRVSVSDPSRRMRNTVIGAAVGLAVGIGIGFAVCPYCANEGHGGKYVGPAAAAGAGLGAAAGLLPAPYRTIYKAK